MLETSVLPSYDGWMRRMHTTFPQSLLASTARWLLKAPLGIPCSSPWPSFTLYLPFPNPRMGLETEVSHVLNILCLIPSNCTTPSLCPCLPPLCNTVFPRELKADWEFTILLLLPGSDFQIQREMASLPTLQTHYHSEAFDTPHLLTAAPRLKA